MQRLRSSTENDASPGGGCCCLCRRRYRCLLRPGLICRRAAGINAVKLVFKRITRRGMTSHDGDRARGKNKNTTAQPATGITDVKSKRRQRQNVRPNAGALVSTARPPHIALTPVSLWEASRDDVTPTFCAIDVTESPVHHRRHLHHPISSVFVLCYRGVVCSQ